MTSTNQNTDDLIELCKAKNQQAQMEVYNRYYKAMFNTAYRIVNKQDEAEDIMQESFLTAFAKLNTLKDTKMFGPWLKRIVINQSIKAYNVTKSKYEVGLNEHLYKIPTNDYDHEELSNDIVISALKKAMTTLKSNYKIILSLHYIEGYDQDEICEIMKINNGNCRTMLSRAKEKLRQNLLGIPKKTTH